MAEKLGYEAKLYYDATPLANGPLTASWDELTKVRDVNLNIDAGEADMTSRANAGWTATKQALKNASIEFDMIWNGADTHMEAIRDAFLNGTEIAMACMDGDIAVALTEGLVSNFEIFGFNRNEPLADGMTVSIVAKPSSHTQWYEVAP